MVCAQALATWFHGSSSVLGFLSVAVAWPQPAVWPSTYEWCLLVLISLTSFAGQLSLNYGYSHLPTLTASALYYLMVVWSSALGLLFLGERVDYIRRVGRGADLRRGTGAQRPQGSSRARKSEVSHDLKGWAGRALTERRKMNGSLEIKRVPPLAFPLLLLQFLPRHPRLLHEERAREPPPALVPPRRHAPWLAPAPFFQRQSRTQPRRVPLLTTHDVNLMCPVTEALKETHRLQRTLQPPPATRRSRSPPGTTRAWATAPAGSYRRLSTRTPTRTALSPPPPTRAPRRVPSEAVGFAFEGSTPRCQHKTRRQSNCTHEN